MAWLVVNLLFHTHTASETLPTAPSQGADTYFVNTHLLESCLQHLEVVDVLML